MELCPERKKHLRHGQDLHGAMPREEKKLVAVAEKLLTLSYVLKCENPPTPKTPPNLYAITLQTCNTHIPPYREVSHATVRTRKPEHPAQLDHRVIT